MNKKSSHKMWYDIAKFLTIAIIVHLLLCVVDDFGELFSEQILKIYLYLIISLVVYHLLIKKLMDKLFKKSKKVD
jgi:hypothetical protein